ncbi:hypothetical protein HDU92_005837, partial [Lobulomyces angularis]
MSLIATFENALEILGEQIKPYLPILARTLLVSTFIEDTIRIITQWKDQVFYLTHTQKFPWLTAESFLIFNVVAMVLGSALCVGKKKTEVAVGLLFTSVFSQAIGYGLIFDSSFFFRTLSVIGALFMLLADAFASKRKNFNPGVPELNDKEKHHYIQLFGRILLVFLFISFIFNGEFSFLRVIFGTLSLISCIMVAVGFKAKWSATILITILCFGN